MPNNGMHPTADTIDFMFLQRCGAAGDAGRSAAGVVMSDSSDKLEALKKLAAGFDEVFEFRRSLSNETDRGCALMAAAYLDSELEKLLRKYFVDNENVKNEVFGHSRPLGTFSSRIDLAYLVGLIGPKAHRDLHLIRKVRNEFGHVPTPISFDDQSLASRCRELYYDSYGKDAAPRVKFNRVVMGVLGVLHATLHSIKPIEESQDVLIDDAKRESFNKSFEGLFESIEKLFDSDDAA